MGLILWPAALLLFLFWSLAAWLLFGVSDWAAGHVASAVGGVLTAELGPWAAWLIGSLGTLIKLGIIAVWAIVSIGILGAPLWLRQKRRAGQIPDAYRAGYQLRGERRDSRVSYHPEADDDFRGSLRDRDNHHRPWRDRKAWQQRAHQGYEELSFLRDAVGETLGKYRRKKKRKRDDDDD
jgi:hypothetical protein